MKQYKTFEDLVFKPHPRLHSGLQATLEFDNGYGASVLIGDLFYSDGAFTYEIACMKDGSCAYPKGSSFEDDVLGYRGPEEITELLKEIQDLPKVD